MKRRHETPLKRVNAAGKTRWVARYTGPDGKRRSAGTYDRRGDAQDAINAAYLERPASLDMTVGEYAATWTVCHPRSVRTDETNDSRLSAVLGPVTPTQKERGRERAQRKRQAYRPSQGVRIEGTYLRDWQLRDVRPRQVTALVDVLLREQGRALLGAKGVLLTFSAMWGDAVRDELADFNPFREVRIRHSDPRIQKAARRSRVVSWDDMHRLAAAAGEHEPMVRVLSDCGLRLAEMLALYRADMAIGGCTVPDCPATVAHFHVRRSSRHGVVSVGTKRERLRGIFEDGRIVPIPVDLEPLLRAMPRRIDSPLLFPTVAGKCFWENNFRVHVWNPARAASGVDATPQDFRHSWVSHLRAARIDPADLAEMAGHSVIVASSVYTHSMQRSFEAVAKACSA